MGRGRKGKEGERGKEEKVEEEREERGGELCHMVRSKVFYTIPYTLSGMGTSQGS